MVNDTHHAVRMHMARVVLSLYFGDRSSQAFLPRPVQEETFQEVSKMLETAHMVTVSSLCVWKRRGRDEGGGRGEEGRGVFLVCVCYFVVF